MEIAIRYQKGSGKKSDRSPEREFRLKIYEAAWQQLSTAIDCSVARSFATIDMELLELFDRNSTLTGLLPTVVVFSPPGAGDLLQIRHLADLIGDNTDFNNSVIVQSSEHTTLASILGLIKNSIDPKLSNLDELRSRLKMHVDVDSILVAIDSFEALPPPLVENLVIVLSDLMDLGLRVKLLISTSLMRSAFVHMLTQPALQALDVAYLYSPSAARIFEAVANTVFIGDPDHPARIVPLENCDNELDLAFSSDIMDLLFHMYYSYNFNLKSFKKGLRLALLHHFLDAPEALLCDVSPGFDNLNTALKNKELFAKVTDLSAVQDNLEGKSGSKRKHILAACQRGRDAVRMQREILRTLHSGMSALLQYIPFSTYAKTSDLFVALNKGTSFLLDPDFEKIKKGIRALDVDNVLNICEAMRPFLHQLDREFGTTEFGTTLDSFKNRFENLDENQAKLDAQQKIGEKTKKGIVSSLYEKGVKVTPQDLRKKLIEAGNVAKEQNFFETEKKKFVEFLHGVVLHALESWENVSFRNVYTCKDSQPVQLVIEPKMREDMGTFLTNPENVEKHPICKAYQIYTEHGRAIPLSVMYESFKSLSLAPENPEMDADQATPGSKSVKTRKTEAGAAAQALVQKSSKKGKAKGQTENDPASKCETGQKGKKRKAEEEPEPDKSDTIELQTKFLEAVHELHWMGLLRPMGKTGEMVAKADY